MKFADIKKAYKKKPEKMSLTDFLEKAEKDSKYYLSPSERMLQAIGPPEYIDTSTDSRLARLYGNKIIKRYEVFKDFYGMDNVIEQIVSYFTHSAQGLEESKQILYLLGPVGGGKSSLAEKLKNIFEKVPFYAIEGSPVFESPLSVLSMFPELSYNIPQRYIPYTASPWLIKRIDELEGDISQLTVVKMYPSKARQIAIAKTEPGDENNQDISTLVGKLDIRKLESFAADDPDAYRYNGGLCLGNRGILEFVEMFKAPIKVLHPLLTATQEANYKGTEQLSPIPFDGMIIAHSNESEWQLFKENKQNEAFLDRIYIVKVPYTLSKTNEEQIYKQYIKNSSLPQDRVAPHTLSLLASFAVMTRIHPEMNVSQFIKLKVYDGEGVKARYPKADTYIEYKDRAPLDEGFSGFSTRSAFKLLSKTFNYDSEEVGANPAQLFVVLANFIRNEDMPKDIKRAWLTYLQDDLLKEYIQELKKDFQVAYLDSYQEYGQNIFDKYLVQADHWIRDEDLFDKESNYTWTRAQLDSEMQEIENLASISNVKEFRNEVVHANLRYAAANGGKHIKWTSDERIKEVIEKKLFKAADDLMSIIATSKHSSVAEDVKRQELVERMVKNGYTERQVTVLAQFLMRMNK